MVQLVLIDVENMDEHTLLDDAPDLMLLWFKVGADLRK